VSEQEKNMLTLFVAVIIVGIFGAIIYVVLQQQEEEVFKNKFGEEVLALCTTPLVSPEHDYRNMPIRSVRRVLVLEGDKESDWHDAVPDQWRAETSEELTIVACVSDERDVNLERCPYEDNVYIDRYARSRVVALFNADTGELITRFDVHGSPPTACEDVTWAEVGEVKERRGRKPADEQFIAALQVELSR